MEKQENSKSSTINNEVFLLKICFDYTMFTNAKRSNLIPNTIYKYN